MEVINALLNIVLVVFIVSTMLAAGLGTTIAGLRETFRHVGLVILVLVMNLVLVPLIGWGTATVLSVSEATTRRTRPAAIVPGAGQAP